MTTRAYKRLPPLPVDLNELVLRIGGAQVRYACRTLYAWLDDDDKDYIAAAVWQAMAEFVQSRRFVRIVRRPASRAVYRALRELGFTRRRRKGRLGSWEPDPVRAGREIRETD